MSKHKKIKIELPKQRNCTVKLVVTKSGAGKHKDKNVKQRTNIMSKEMNELSEYRVNLDQVIQKDDHYIIAQEIAVLVKMNGLMSVGSILKSIPNDRLQEMIDFIEETYQDEPIGQTCHEELMILSLMLIQAEGGQLSMSEEFAVNSMHQTMLFLMMESLYRKGLIELLHENLSFDEASSTRFVAKATHQDRDFVGGNSDDS